MFWDLPLVPEVRGYDFPTVIELDSEPLTAMASRGVVIVFRADHVVFSVDDDGSGTIVGDPILPVIAGETEFQLQESGIQVLIPGQFLLGTTFTARYGLHSWLSTCGLGNKGKSGNLLLIL